MRVIKINEDETDETCNTAGEFRNEYRIFVGNTEAKKSFRSPRCKWNSNNIKSSLYKSVGNVWTGLNRLIIRSRRRADINTWLNLWVL
jgi:hypothetical protein